MKHISRWEQFVREYANEDGKIFFEHLQKGIEAAVLDDIDATTDTLSSRFLAATNGIFYTQMIEEFDKSGKKSIKYKTVDIGNHFVTRGARDPYIALKNAIDSIKSEHIDFTRFADKLPLKPNKKRFVRACQRLLTNLDHTKVDLSAENMRQFCASLLSKIHPGAYRAPSPVMLYLVSLVIGGVGKGRFISRLVTFFKSLGLEVNENASWKTKWLNEKFGTCLLTTVDEYNPLRANETILIENQNKIIDNSIYIMEQKNQAPTPVKSNTSIVIATNFEPKEPNQRRYAKVYYSNFQISSRKFTPEEAEILHTDWTDDDWNKCFYDLFTSCPYDEPFEVKNVEANSLPQYYNTLKMIQRLNNTVELSKEETIHSLAELSNAQSLSLEPLYTKNNIKSMVFDLVNQGVIKPVKRINNRLEYSKYDFTNVDELVKLVEEQQPSPYPVTDNAIIDTEAAWNYLLSTIPGDDDDDGDDGNDPNGGNDPTVNFDDLDSQVAAYMAEHNFDETHEVKDTNMLECKDKFSIPTNESSTENQFVITANYTEEGKAKLMTEDTINRKSENMYPTHIVFESDTLPIEEQKKLAEKLYKLFPNSVTGITFSGSKSLHTLVKIAEKESDYDKSIDFKDFCHEFVNKYIPEYANDLDEACFSVGRLSRRPSAIRDNGIEQACYYWNNEATKVDTCDIQAELKEKAKAQAMNYAIRKIAAEYKKSKFGEQTEEQRLMNYANANPEKWDDVVRLYQGEDLGSGYNYIGLLGRCKIAGLNEVYKVCAENAHRFHPTNIGRKNI